MRPSKKSLSCSPVESKVDHAAEDKDLDPAQKGHLFRV